VGHQLRVPDTLAFPGEAATSCRVPAGPARALNLMTRRGCVAGASRAVDVATAHRVTVGDHETVVLVALTSGLTADGGVALGVLDAVFEDAVGAVEVSGTGLLAELRIDRCHQGKYRE
jgi:environmental stress-induced protein Ves